MLKFEKTEYITIIETIYSNGSNKNVRPSPFVANYKNILPLVEVIPQNSPDKTIDRNRNEFK